MKESFKQSDLTNKVLRCFYTVYNKLGYGFLEKVYEKALLLELRKNGLNAVRQVPLKFITIQLKLETISLTL